MGVANPATLDIGESDEKIVYIKSEGAVTLCVEKIDGI